jgi:hypothetical protein
MGRPTSPADVSGIDACSTVGLRLGFESFLEHFVVGGYHDELDLVTFSWTSRSAVVL